MAELFHKKGSAFAFLFEPCETTCLQDVVYLLMGEWILKARQNILTGCLLYTEMFDNTGHTAHNNNKVNGMDFPSPRN